MAHLHVYTTKENSKLFSKNILLTNLSYYLGVAASSIEVARSENGKPSVDGINFSISHCRDIVVQVFSKYENIGIDIEYINPSRKYMKLANRYFHNAEKQYLQNLSENESANMFYNLWTAKEAVCKAEGGRLWYYLADNYLTHDNKMKTTIKGLKLQSFNTVQNFALTVAISGNNHHMEIVSEI